MSLQFAEQHPDGGPVVNPLKSAKLLIIYYLFLA